MDGISCRTADCGSPGSAACAWCGHHFCPRHLIATRLRNRVGHSQTHTCCAHCLERVTTTYERQGFQVADWHRLELN
jgi:hypothetical protein